MNEKEILPIFSGADNAKKIQFNEGLQQIGLTYKDWFDLQPEFKKITDYTVLMLQAGQKPRFWFQPGLVLSEPIKQECVNLFLSIF